MKKPDYCPDWFNISIYGKLSDFSRDELAMALWFRQINYDRIKEGMSIGSHLTKQEKEDAKEHSLNFLKDCANEWITHPCISELPYHSNKPPSRHPYTPKANNR